MDNLLLYILLGIVIGVFLGLIFGSLIFAFKRYILNKQDVSFISEIWSMTALGVALSVTNQVKDHYGDLGGGGFTIVFLGIYLFLFGIGKLFKSNNRNTTSVGYSEKAEDPKNLEDEKRTECMNSPSLHKQENQKPLYNNKSHKNALMAIEFRSEVKSAFDSLKDLPEQFKLQFLDLLEDNPKGSVDNYIDIVMKEYNAWLKPYENDKFNLVLQDVRELGLSAEKEFQEITNVLGDSVDPVKIYEKLKKKWVNESKYLNMNSNEILGDLCDRYNMTSEQLKEHFDIKYNNGVYVFNNKNYESFVDAALIADTNKEQYWGKANNVFVSKEEVKDNNIVNNDKSETDSISSVSIIFALVGFTMIISLGYLMMTH